MAIKDWPEGERPRERLLAHGVRALSDAELLAVFLRTGSAGRSAIDVGRAALAHFGGLNALLAATPDRYATRSRTRAGEVRAGAGRGRDRTTGA